MAIRGRIGDPRPAWRQVAGLAIAPLLPRPLWQAGRHLFGTGSDPLGVTAIRRDWPGLKQTLRRSRHAGYDVERLQFASKRAHWRALLAEDGQEQDQYVLGMELIHGLGRRDPTAYRPLVEFCWGCPTDLFLRDGTDRWLAREMARGLMPEAQRLDRAYGHQFADWQPRFAPIRGELMDELGRMADDPDIAALIDLPRLMRLVEAIPDEPGDYDPQAALPYQIALPIGIAAARFIAYAKGRNDI
jgi:asparagine synthase (glutamine-hydrolysing)